MSGSRNLLARVPNVFRKSFTFTDASGSGAVGTVAVGTVTGSILFHHLTARVLTTLVGAATLEMGTAGNTAALIAQVADATDLADGDFWIGATSPANVAAAILDMSVEQNIIMTVGSTAITAGKIEVVGFWLPLSDDGKIT